MIMTFGSQTITINFIYNRGDAHGVHIHTRGGPTLSHPGPGMNEWKRRERKARVALDRPITSKAVYMGCML